MSPGSKRTPATAALLVMAVAAPARADTAAEKLATTTSGYGELGADISTRELAISRTDTEADLSGYLRIRGDALYNLDLDRGLTPSGNALFPVPAADPSAQTLTLVDSRLRTDVAIYPPGSGVAVKVRVDVLDNLAWGTATAGELATGQPAAGAISDNASRRTFRVKRAYGEALIPVGLLAAGRIGAQWGLGMVANGGDCPDCDGGDAADRIALVTPLFDHLVAVSYDFAATGPVRQRRDGARAIDFEPTDDIRTLTVAALHYHTPLARARLLAAGRAAFEYGALFSHSHQENDVPAAYLPAAAPIAVDPAQIVARGFATTAVDGWLRLALPLLRIEAEVAYVTATVDEPSLIPGVDVDQSITSRQLGIALESDLHSPGGQISGGVDGGYASGDPAPGFGAFPVPGQRPPQPGDVDGPQAALPGDTTVDNFRFDSDYHIDRILFREIIGTVTDAVYVRPHARATLLQTGHARVTFGVAAIASWAAEAQSTPGGDRFLGVEIDPTLGLYTRDGFSAVLESAVLIPGPAFDNHAANLTAQVAQLWRVRLGYWF
ncbi:MAG TPA: TIGR04551 family protein [Kofleriaceae bacterium]|nr:TIGR04551 family protein [Kofleriaceae bacterium]